MLVLSVAALLNRFVSPRLTPCLAIFFCIAYILPLLLVLPTLTRSERDIQRYIEAPVRQAMGEYLFLRKKPGDRVGCEPLGYVAYYSRMPVDDFPGLANREVTEFFKANPSQRTLGRMLEHFRPEWIALREREYQSFVTRPGMQFLESEYQVEKIFRADPLETARIFRVRGNIDRVFLSFAPALTRACVPLHGLPVHFDPGDIGPATRTMAAPRDQVHEPDFIHFAQVGVLHPISFGEDFVGVQAQPADFRD
jgi:hypothetical protein